MAAAPKFDIFAMFRDQPQNNQNNQNNDQNNNNQSNNNKNNQQQTQQQQNQMADPNNPLIPNDQNNQNQQDKSPLAEFKGLWDTPTVKEGQPPVIDWNDPNSIVPNIQIDPAKVVEASKKVDFSRALNPETVKKALAGDVQAFGEVINSVAQSAFANSAMMSSRIVENAMKQMAPKLINDAIPHHMKRFSVNESFSAENPIFNNPAVAPMLENMKRQFQNQYPKASAKEITDMAKKYVLEFATAVTGGKGGPGDQRQQQNQTTEQDWIQDFLGEATPRQQ